MPTATWLVTRASLRPRSRPSRLFDTALSKVIPAIEVKGGFALITADHGNADHMFDVDGEGHKHPFTAHTTNRVPLIVVDDKAKLVGIEDGRPVDIAPTMLTLAGLEPSKEMTGPRARRRGVAWACRLPRVVRETEPRLGRRARKRAKRP